MSPRRAPATVAGVEIAPGRSARVDLNAGTLISGQPIAMTAQVLHGRTDGPTAFLCAAIHGDEILGVEIIRRVLEVVDVRSISGTLIVVPIVNVHGFNTGDRYLPDRRDLNRAFPGSPRGSQASRLARTLMTEVVGPSDVGIDLHTGAWGRRNLPQIRADLSDGSTLDLAKEFGAPVIIDSRVRDGSLRQAATEAGTTVLLYEAGENLRFDEPSIGVGQQGVLRVLGHLGMIEHDLGEVTESAVSPGSGWVRANRSGIAHPTEPLGARVEKGQVVAELMDPFGKRLAKLRSRWDGIVIGLDQHPLVNRGDAICHVARVDDPDVAEVAVAAMPDEVARGATPEDGGDA